MFQVKREDTRRIPSVGDPDAAWLSDSDSRMRGIGPQWQDEGRRGVLSPPPDAAAVYGLAGPPPATQLLGMMQDPGTPPETPPGSSPSCGGGRHHHHQLVTSAEDMMWFPPGMRAEQPLDLRPTPHYMAGEPDWERREYIPSGERGSCTSLL